MWKRHVDHLRRREPSSDESPCQTAEPKDSVVSTNSETDDNATIQVEEGHEQLPSVAQAQSSEITKTNQCEETGPPESAPNTVDEPSIPVDSPTECRRSSRKSKPPDRLIESM